MEDRRGGGGGGARGSIVPFTRLPTAADILQTLQVFASKMIVFLSRTTRLDLDGSIETPALFPAGPEFECYRRFDGYSIYENDVNLNTSMAFPRSGTVLHNGRVRALGRELNLRYMDLTDVTGINMTFPYVVENRESQLSLDATYWRNSLLPTFVLNRLASNYLLHRTWEGQYRYKMLKYNHHANDCYCSNMVEANNMEFCLFSIVCVPK